MKKEIQRAAEKWNDQYSRKRVSWRRLQRSQLRLSSRLANIPDFKGSVIDAIAYRLSNARPDQMYSNAISVGCGTGESEMYLVRHGIVTHFDLFEISEVAIKRGKSIAKQWGLQDRVTFHLGDVFTYPISNDYDLVYWHHSLHHMLDVSKAVEFSKNILKVGGIFSAYEYVGPNRFQFSDTNLSIANRILETLPDHLLKNPEDPQKLLPRHQQRVALKRIIADDPTEAVDSENIIPAIQSHFPQAEITTLSANIARLVLGYILQNLSEDEDDLLINLVLLVDDMAIQLGIHHDAFILASKNSEESENHSGKDAKNFSECSGA